MTMRMCIPVHSRALLAAFLFGALLGGCRKEEAKGPPARPPVPVKVAAAGRQTVPVELRTVGNVEAVATVEIKAQVGGTLARVHFREGDEVRRGELLFTIDPRPFEAALHQAEAILARDQAQLENARQKERRYGELLTGRFISQQEYELVQTDAAAFEATVRADRAALESARLRLSWCTIRSPLDGRTGSLLAHAGDLIKADADQPMVVIHQLRPIDVAFAVPEQQLSRIRQQLAAGGVVVQALLPGEEARAEEGRLTFVDNAVDTATGTIRLKGSFANAAGRLWPGQFVTALLVLGTLQDVVTVPSAAVQTGQQGTFVFVVKDDQSVEQRPVTAGIAWQGRTVVEGVQADETVVVDGQMRLTPGARVEVKSDNAGTGSQPAPAATGKHE
jgi:multidrug efflux system membrane fusion protein